MIPMTETFKVTALSFTIEKEPSRSVVQITVILGEGHLNLNAHILNPSPNHPFTESEMKTILDFTATKVKAMFDTVETTPSFLNS